MGIEGHEVENIDEPVKELQTVRHKAVERMIPGEGMIPVGDRIRVHPPPKELFAAMQASPQLETSLVEAFGFPIPGPSRPPPGADPGRGTTNY